MCCIHLTCDVSPIPWDVSPATATKKHISVIRVVDGLQNARSESVSTTRSKQSKHYISHVWGAVMKAFEPLKMTPGNTIFQQVVFHYSFRES